MYVLTPAPLAVIERETVPALAIGTGEARPGPETEAVTPEASVGAVKVIVVGTPTVIAPGEAVNAPLENDAGATCRTMGPLMARCPAGLVTTSVYCVLVLGLTVSGVPGTTTGDPPLLSTTIPTPPERVAVSVVWLPSKMAVLCSENPVMAGSGHTE